jgi:preprotein translocase subunit SecG
METVLIVVHLVIVVALCGIVLIQKSEGGGLGMGGGSGSPSGLFTGRGQANLLTRSTAILGAAFFLTSLLLSVLAAQNRTPRSVIDQVAPASQTQPTPTPTAPLQDLKPAGEGTNVLDQLQRQQTPAQTPAQNPAAPAQQPAPSAPAQ